METKDLIKKIYDGRDKIENKIASLITMRANNKDKEDIQKECNKYLTLLYDQKYNKKLSEGKRKKERALGWWQKFNTNPNAGNVEKGNEIFNHISSGEALSEQINIAQRLNELDKENYLDLLNMYKANNFSEEEKRHLAKLLSEGNDIHEIYKFLENKTLRRE